MYFQERDTYRYNISEVHNLDCTVSTYFYLLQIQTNPTCNIIFLWESAFIWCSLYNYTFIHHLFDIDIFTWRVCAGTCISSMGGSVPIYNTGHKLSCCVQWRVFVWKWNTPQSKESSRWVALYPIINLSAFTLQIFTSSM